MKKLTIALIVLAILACSVFALTACNKEETTTDPFAYDLSKMEVGDEIPVYPGVSFDYVLEDGNVVHIESITATLVAKNVINEGDTIEGKFYPYEIEFNVKAKTSAELVGENIVIYLADDELTGFALVDIVDENGSLTITDSYGFVGSSPLRFSNISIMY